MKRFISRSSYAFLRGELSAWTDASLLTREQADAISALYRVRSYSFPQTLLIGGALLIGLGGICAVAANWWDIPRAARSALIVGVYLACMTAAAACAERYARTSRALRLLASMLFGVGIFLSAQMYHQGGHWSTAFGWWAAGVLPGALLLRDRAQTLLFQALTFFFTVGNVAFFSPYGTDALLRRDVLPGLALAASWFLTRGDGNGTVFNVSVLLSLVYGFTRLEIHADLATALLVLWGAGAFCFAALSADGPRGGKAALVYWGGLLAGSMGLILSVPEVWYDWGPLGKVESLAAVYAPRFAGNEKEILAAGAAALTAALMAYRLRRGSRMAAAFLALTALRYFADRFFGFMSKAAVFSALGAICLALGIFWERRSRRKKENGDV